MIICKICYFSITAVECKARFAQSSFSADSVVEVGVYLRFVRGLNSLHSSYFVVTDLSWTPLGLTHHFPCLYQTCLCSSQNRCGKHVIVRLLQCPFNPFLTGV